MSKNNKQTQKTQAPASKKKAVKEVKRDLARAEEDDIKSIIYGSRDHLSKAADRYLKTLVDPKRSKGGKPISPLGGYHRATRLEITKAEVDFTPGANNVGFLCVDPGNAEGVSDRVSWIASSSAWTGTTSTPLPTAAGVGVAVGYQTDAPFNTSAATGGPAELCSRVVASAIYVYPTGTATGQAGNLFMLETPLHSAEVLHSGVAEAMTISDVEGHPRTRALRGVQFGPVSEENCLNWHPTSSRIGTNVYGTSSDYQFSEIRAASAVFTTNHRHTPQIITISGVAGTIWHAEIFMVYEYIGRKAGAMTKCPTDSRGADLIFAALFDKNVSGWIGKPSHAIASYGVATEKQERSIVSEMEKASRKVSSVLDSPLWGQAAGLARDVAGFFL